MPGVDVIRPQSRMVKGKASMVRLMKKSKHLQDASRVLSDANSTKESIKAASVKGFQIVSSRSVNEALSKTRYNMYM